MPKRPEQLRAKRRLMGNLWTFLRLRYRKQWLEGVTPDTMRRYADYLLGSKVWNMPMPEASTYRLS
eukprot:10322010-Karenia_brevis.AAC.1